MVKFNSFPVGFGLHVIFRSWIPGLDYNASCGSHNETEESAGGHDHFPPFWVATFMNKNEGNLTFVYEIHGMQN